MRVDGYISTAMAKLSRTIRPMQSKVQSTALVPKCITLDGLLKRLELRRYTLETQNAFAERIGISQPLLSQIVNRKRPPNDVLLGWLGLRRVDHYYEVVGG